MWIRTDLKFERRPRSFGKTHGYRISLLYPMCYSLKNKLVLSWGKLRREPATRWFDESFAPILRSGGNDLHVSSAQRKLPPSFHLASPCPSIVHHLSGLNWGVLWYDYCLMLIGCKNTRNIRKHTCKINITSCLFIITLYCSFPYKNVKTWYLFAFASPLLRFMWCATTHTPVELLGPCFKTGRIVASENIFINKNAYIAEAYSTNNDMQ